MNRLSPKTAAQLLQLVLGVLAIIVGFLATIGSRDLLQWHDYPAVFTVAVAMQLFFAVFGNRKMTLNGQIVGSIVSMVLWALLTGGLVWLLSRPFVSGPTGLDAYTLTGYVLLGSL